MPRRVKQNGSLFKPLADNLTRRLSNADARWRRKALRLGVAAVAVYFFFSLMVGTYSLPRIVRLELEKRSLEQANRQLLIHLIDNDRVRRMLKSDSRLIEHIARTRYHMVRPNETIYFYQRR
ncbi:MAG: septum formation initiator family protein [bacterium]